MSTSLKVYNAANPMNATDWKGVARRTSLLALPAGMIYLFGSFVLWVGGSVFGWGIRGYKNFSFVDAVLIHIPTVAAWEWMLSTVIVCLMAALATGLLVWGWTVLVRVLTWIKLG